LIRFLIPTYTLTIIDKKMWEKRKNFAAVVNSSRRLRLSLSALIDFDVRESRVRRSIKYLVYIYWYIWYILVSIPGLYIYQFELYILIDRPDMNSSS
jgi:hypothetical protein